MRKTAIHKFFALAAIFAILVIAGPARVSAEPFFKNFIGTSDISAIIAFIANFIIKIGVPILVIMMMIAGFKFVAAQGNDKKLAEARAMLFWTVIGAAVVVSAGFLASAVVNFGKSLGP